MTKILLFLGLAVVGWRVWKGHWPWEAKLSGTTRQQTLFRARKLLGVGDGASHGEIVEAHRRLIAQVHPDKGGTSEQVHEANAARDLLLAELPGS
jgi:preprotein translocase subunit Sec63